MMKKILALTIVAVILVCGTIISGATSIDELEARQAELERQSAEFEDILSRSDAEIEKQQGEVDALVGKVQTVNEEISVSHQKIAVLDEQIQNKQKEINQANADIENKMNVLRQRIKTIYIAGDVNSLEIILGAKDFSDFLDKVQLVRSVSNHDEALIAEIQQQLEKISAEKKELEGDKASQEAEQENLEAKQQELNTLLEENKETLANLQSENTSTRQRLQLTEEELSGLSQEIQDYYAEIARQQAAAEAARQAALAAQQAAEEDGSEDIFYEDVPDPANAGVAVEVPASGYVWPCPGFYGITAPFAEQRSYESHGGVDIAEGGIMGAIIVAADSGTVISTCTTCPHNWGKFYSCGCGMGYGNYVWIDHGNGKETIYGHMSSVAVSPGDYVSAGQVIGYVGSTGFSTGAHLHFECRYNGVQYNPLSEF